MDSPVPSSIRADAESNAAASNCPWVALQFDDRVFTLSRSSLTGEPNSLFAALFDPASVSGSSVDRNHSHPLKPVIFDRSSKYVEPVLQYLRTGELGVPDDADVGTLRAIYLEASYFGVTGAMEQLADMEPDVLKTAAERRREKAGRPTPPNFTRADVERLLLALPGQAPPRTSSSQNSAYRARWCGVKFAGVDFTELCLAAIDFERCEFNGCKFVRADLSGSNLSNAEMEGADFTSAVLTDVRCVGTLASKSSFRNAACVGADFSRCILVQADFTSANLNNACFDSSDLSESKLAGADLTLTKLHRALLRGVERQGTSLSMGGVIQANSPQDSGVGRAGSAFMRAMGVGSADIQ